MAYDRYDTRDMPRDERSRWRDERGFQDRSQHREHGSRHNYRSGRDERGFFERAGDEIASWFGDEEAERRRRRDQSRDQVAERGSWGHRDPNQSRESRRGWDRDPNMSIRQPRDWQDEHSAFSRGRSPQDFREREREDRDPGQGRRQGRERNWNDNRGVFARGGSSERDYDPDWREEHSTSDFNRSRDRELDRGWTDRYQPITGDYGRSGERFPDGDRDFDRSHSKWAEDEYRGTSRAGSANWSDRSREDRSDRSREDRFDPHYRSWRDRHLDEIDREYDDYRAENHSRFASDFGSWRERRQEKRGLLSQIREHMEVVSRDGKPVGTAERTAGDRLILAKSGPKSGGIHHSISCSDIDRVEGERVILNCDADEARQHWRDESRGRALFEREDEGEMGPRVLDRSFGGTYR